MKKLILLLVTTLIFANLSWAQTPPYYNNNAASSFTSFPLNTTATNDKMQLIYGPGEFSSAPSGNIDTLWLQCNASVAAGAGPFTNFELSLGQNIGTSTTLSTTFNTGLTSVFSNASYTTAPINIAAPQDGWIAIPLTTSFAFDPTLSLVVEIKSVGSNNSNGAVLRADPVATGGRIYGNYASATGLTQAVLIDMGMSLSPIPPVFTPPHFNSNTAASFSAFPLQNSTNDKAAYIYGPGEFNNAPSGIMDTLWLRCFTNRPAGAGPYTNFEVSIGQNIGTSTTLTTTFPTGLTSVFSNASYTTAPINLAPPQDGWIAIPLTTPFVFDSTQSLVVEIKSVGSNTVNGTLIRSFNSASGGRIYGGYASATGLTQSVLIDMGMSLSPIPPVFTPPHFNSNTAGSFTAFPLQNSTNDKAAYIYGPGEFNNAPSGIMDTLWLRSFTNRPAGAGPYTNFEVSIGQNIGTSTTLTTTFPTGLTSVFSNASYTTAPINLLPPQDGWIAIPLTTPFVFDSTQSLVVEIKSVGSNTVNGTLLRSNNVAAGGRIYGDYASATGITQSVHIDMGMSITSAAPVFTPPHYNTNVGSSFTSFPLNTNASNDKTQYIYGPGEFLTAPVGTIDTLWLQCNTNRAAGAGPYTNFEVSLGQNIGTSTTLSSTFFTGLTAVFANGSYTTNPISTAVPQDGWIAIPLTTSFAFDPALSLVVEIKSVGSNSINGTSLKADFTTNGGRIYGSYANATGTTQSVLVDIGMSVTCDTASIPDILYYKFDGTGATIPNLASAPPPGTATATIVGAQTQGGAGQTGTSLIGTGGSGTVDYVNTNWNTNLGTGSWTISFWSAGVNANTSISYVFGDPTAANFRCFTGGVAGNNNWMLRGGGMTDVLITAGADANPHVNTFVYDSTAGQIRAYLDGTLVNTVSQPILNITGTVPFKVGAATSSIGYMVGARLDEFRVYGRALVTNELKNLVNNYPLALTTATPPNLCTGDSVKLTATAGGPSTIINWYNAPVGGTLIGTTNSGDTLTLAATAGGYYSQVVLGSLGKDTFNFTGTIDTFMVPANVTSITIEAAGAEGNTASGSAFAGGLGARVSGTIAVTPGTGLRILVGQKQTTNGNGGGGGSFVTTFANAPLMVAGGGAGSSNAANTPNKHGQAASSGQNGTSGGGNGGTAGNGGAIGAAAFQSGAGGGLLTNGTDGFAVNSGGKSFLNGGAGGVGNPVGLGGFGGGGCGSGNVVGGAGGGYSGGGAGGNTPSGGVGGGGGSFNGGTAQTNLTAVRTGNGRVIITYNVPTCDTTPARSQVLVTVDTLPIVTATPSNVTSCYGDAVTLVGGGSTTYSWTGGIMNNNAFVPTSSTVYTVTGIDASGCSNTATANVVVGAGSAIFADGFETGTLLPHWAPGTNTTAVVAGGSAQGTFHLTQIGIGGFNGPIATVPPSQPTEISWSMRTNDTSQINGYVVVGDSNAVGVGGPFNFGAFFVFFNGGGELRVFASALNDLRHPVVPNTWYQVAFRNINWTTKVADVYVDNVLLQAAFPFRVAATNTIERISLFNNTSATATASYDDFNISSGLKLSNATASNAASTAGSGTGSKMQNASTATEYYDGSCDLIAEISNNATPLGNTVADVLVSATVPTHNGQPYVARRFQITPTNNVAADVKFFFTQDDFNDYNAAAGTSWPLLPANPTDAAGIANVRVTKNDNGGLGVNPIVLTPSSVTWNAAQNRWEVLTSVPSFSQFRIHALNPANGPLPITLGSFTVSKLADADLVEWTTKTESNNSHFDVQRSSDGFDFETLGTVKTKAANGNSSSELAYKYLDNAPKIGNNFYRLQQVDINGNQNYSEIINIVWTDGNVITIYPNPTKDILNVCIATSQFSTIEVKLLDMSGRVVKSVIAQTASGVNKMQLSLGELSPGIYGVQVYENSKLTHVEKVRKND